MSELRGGAPVPPSPFPVLPLRTGVLLPGTSLTLTVGRPRSLALLRQLHVGDVLAVVSQRDPRVVEPGAGDLHTAGTFARVLQISRQSDRSFRLVIEGLDRFRLQELTATEPHWLATGDVLPDREGEGEEALLLGQALRRAAVELARDAGITLGELPEDLPPGLLADRLAATLGLETEEALRVLETDHVPDRLRLVTELLGLQRSRAELRTKVENDVRKNLNKHQREHVLREQLKVIKKELDDGSDEGDETERLRARLEKAELPDEIRKIAQRELKRLEALGGQGPEANVIRTYLDWLLELPWAARAPSREDLEAIAQKLDADHFGLDEVKRRILEHMAVLRLGGNQKGSILCLVGPPGVGKTSLGQSIADATGRPFLRIALGGVRDEAEIRGHRRTYVGALPGRILHALRKAKVKNPVVLLDEIDKLGGGAWTGLPEHALLEVLDPEQNKHFTDHYLEAPFDLSEVLFLCTANTLDSLSAPLRDRLEIVSVEGYTLQEKLTIARRHLIPKREKEAGLGADGVTFTDAALTAMVAEYTREAGVRQLEREIGRVMRRVALDVARGKGGRGDAPGEQPAPPAPRRHIDQPDLGDILGKPRFTDEVRERTGVPGVATGLAWTPVGGDILFIETTRMPGKGAVEITGKLGDVMKESARAALSYVRSHAAELGIPQDRIEGSDLHIHVPAGAVPKDGPSAGVTLFTALVSLFSGRVVRPDTAMTGECTLRGRVLPVGGIKSKVLAAHRAGLHRVVLPRRNARDLDDIPREVRDELEFVLVDDMTEVLLAAFENPLGDLPSALPGALVPVPALPAGDPASTV